MSTRQYVDPKSGLIRYRTKLLTPEQAIRFEKCIQANSARFWDVQYHESEQARGDRRCFVSYVAVNPDRLYDAAAREQEKRDARAQAEGEFYLWALDNDGPHPFYHCCSLSGECYEVTAGSCTCPDWQFRCSRASWANLQCKHVRALLAAYERGQLTPLHLVGRSTNDKPATRNPSPVRYDSRDFPD